jgi:hypothetical protein
VVLFVVIIAAVVVGQTWLDWREAERRCPAPAWLALLAVAAVVSISVSVSLSAASSFYQEALAGWRTGSAAWSQAVFLISMTALVAAAVWTRRMRVLLLVTAGLTTAVWLGFSLFL